MLWWTVVAAFYAILAAGATWVSRRNPCVLIGATLILTSLVSSAVCYRGDLWTRVMVEVVAALVLLNSTRIAFLATQAACCIWLACLTVVDLAFCAIVAWTASRIDWDAGGFGLGTNAIFVLMCLGVAAPGVADALGAARRSGLSGGLVGDKSDAVDALLQKLRRVR